MSEQEFHPLVITGSENLKNVALSVPEAAILIKRETVSLAEKVLSVKNVDDQQFAVNVTAQCKRLLKDLESARVKAKEYFKNQCEAIDGTAKDFAKELKAHSERIQGLLNHYQEEIERERQRVESERLKKIQDAENARLKAEQDALNAKNKKQREEAQKKLEEAQKKLEEARKLESKANLDIAPTPVVASGTYGRKKVEWKILDLMAFALAHPELVNIEPKAALINQMTSNGALKQDKTIHIWEAHKAVVQV